MTPAADLRLDAVTQHYRTPGGLVRAVDGISADIPAGCSLAITGPSGGGKSTLLGLIGGLETPTAGRVLLGGREFSGLPAGQRDRVRRQRFGLLFQADNLLPYLTATENVALQLALHHGDRYHEVPPLLGQLGLDADAHKLPDQLSGGQRLRVAVARALIHRPEVILADEPTGSVDSANGAVIVALLRQVARTTGATLIVVTHDPDVADQLDRELHLQAGRPVPGGRRSRGR